ncbi:MAG: flagellar hook assembly protein FlgD [Burkholderiaceae bacterium]
MSVSTVQSIQPAAAIAPAQRTGAASGQTTQSGSQASASFDSLVNSLRGGSAGAGTAAATQGADEDRFLKLLVAQMNNQDPLNPMDNAQVTSQLAQINTVKGIDALNGSVKKLLEQSQAAQTSQAMGLVGRSVLLDGNLMELSPEGMARGAFQLDAPAASVRVEVLDAAGKVVDSRSMNNLPAGMQQFVWDGKGGSLPPGDYALQVTAINGSQQSPVRTYSAVTVQAVQPGSNGAQLNLGSFGSRPMSDIRAYL